MTLPSGWVQTSLGSISTVIRGVTYSKSDARTAPEPDFVPLLRATNIGSRLELDKQMVYVPTSAVAQQQWLQRGDIVVTASSGSLSVVGRNAVLRQDWRGTFGAFCAVVRATDAADADFLALQLTSDAVRRRWSSLARGTNINNLKRSHLIETPVALPPLAEQRRIVELLEGHLSRLDAAGADLDTGESRIAMLWSSFLRSEYLLALQQSYAVPLGKLCESSLGKMLDSKKNVGEQTLYLRNANVRWRSFDLADLLSAPMTDADRDRLTLEADDILVCEGGEPGRCAVWPGSTASMTYQKALHRLRVRDAGSLSPHFVALMLEQAVRGGRTAGLITGTTIKHLPQERLRSLAIPAPSLAEQQAAVCRAVAVSEALAALQRELATARLRHVALRQSLLAAAFSGRLASRSLTRHHHIEEMAGV